MLVERAFREIGVGVLGVFFAFIVSLVFLRTVLAASPL